MGSCKNPTTNKKGTKQTSFVLILTFTYIHGFMEVYVCIELLISQSSGQNLGREFTDIQIDNKAKPNRNSRKFAISTRLYPENKKLRVLLIGRMEKWEDRKWREDGKEWREDRKVEGQKICQFLSFVFGWEGGKVEA